MGTTTSFTSQEILITVNSKAVTHASHYRRATHTVARRGSCATERKEYTCVLVCTSAFCVHVDRSCVCIYLMWLFLESDDAVECLAGIHRFNREGLKKRESQVRWGLCDRRGSPQRRQKQGKATVRRAQKRKNPLPIWRPALVSVFLFLFFLHAFWHGLHPCVSALMAWNVQGGGELVLLHTLSASPENTWQRASSKAAPAFLSQIPQAARAPPNQLLATPFFTVSTRLFTISKETDKIFTNLHTWMVKRGGVEGRSIV